MGKDLSSAERKSTTQGTNIYEDYLAGYDETFGSIVETLKKLDIRLVEKPVKVKKSDIKYFTQKDQLKTLITKSEENVALSEELNDV